MNVFLFGATVLIWGTTWIAIALQIGPVPVLASVFYRFALAGVMLFAILAATRRLSIPAWRHHPFIAAQALCLFCCNFVCFYAATAYIPSGLVSVVFSLATLFNVVLGRILFGTAVTSRVALAALLGVGGIGLLFWHDLATKLDAGSPKGLALAVCGTLFFSFGNMASRRNSAAGIPPSLANAWGMTYGAIMLLVLIGLTGTPMPPPPDGTYLAALLYLALVGSVIGFTTYLSLVARIGPSRSAYATVLFPIVALALSTAFEGYRWHWTGFLGIAVALGGNLLIFSGPAARPNGPTEPRPGLTGDATPLRARCACRARRRRPARRWRPCRPGCHGARSRPRRCRTR